MNWKNNNMINVLFPLSYNRNFNINGEFVSIIDLDIAGEKLLTKSFEQFTNIKDANFYAILPNNDEGKMIDKLLPTNVEKIYTAGNTKGAPCTCLYSIDELNHDNELIVTSLDYFFDVDFNHAINEFRKNNSDAGAITFETTNKKYSFVKIENNKIIQAAEKKSICNIGMIGFYYFKNTADFFKYTKNLLRKQITQYSDNYYISGVMNEMILDNKTLSPYSYNKNDLYKIYDAETYDNFLKLNNHSGINKTNNIKIHKLNDFVRGWIVGNFDPSLYKTNDFEFAVKNFKAGDKECEHYHKIATEITVIVSGKAKMKNTIIETGNVVVILPNEKTEFEALEDTTIAVIKVPATNNDKYVD